MFINYGWRTGKRERARERNYGSAFIRGSSHHSRALQTVRYTGIFFATSRDKPDRPVIYRPRNSFEPATASPPAPFVIVRKMEERKEEAPDPETRDVVSELVSNWQIGRNLMYRFDIYRAKYNNNLNEVIRGNRKLNYSRFPSNYRAKGGRCSHPEKGSERCSRSAKGFRRARSGAKRERGRAQREIRTRGGNGRADTRRERERWGRMENSEEKEKNDRLTGDGKREC